MRKSFLVIVFFYSAFVCAEGANLSVRAPDEVRLAAEIQAEAALMGDEALQILVDSLLAQTHAGDGGLYEVGAAAEHESVSIKQFAHYVHAKYGWFVVLISYFDGIAIPGFDGIILDNKKKILANFPLKKMHFSVSPTKITRSAKRARRQARDFFNAADWGRYIVQAGHDRAPVRKRLAHLFGVEKPRPCFIVLDLLDGDPEARFPIYTDIDPQFPRAYFLTAQGVSEWIFDADLFVKADQIRSDFESQVQAMTESLRQQSLKDFVHAAKALEPSLLVSGEFDSAQLDPIVAYSRHLYNSSGQSLLWIPNVTEIFPKSLKGLVLDKSKKVVANFILEESPDAVSQAQPEHAQELLRAKVRQARSIKIWADAILKDSEVQALAHIFGVGIDRPHYLFQSFKANNAPAAQWQVKTGPLFPRYIIQFKNQTFEWIRPTSTITSDQTCDKNLRHTLDN